jgi:hypothetical protein
MAWLKKYFLNWPAPIYVLLGGAFPALYIYAHNLAQTRFQEAALPLALCLAGAVVLWALLALILRNARKAGLGTAIFLVFFFTYGHLCDGLSYLGVSVPKLAPLLPTMLVIWGFCVYFISRAKRDFRTTTTVLNVVAVALIAINLFNIASYQVKLARLDTGTPEVSPGQAPAASNLTELDTLPDIYFIIMDEYAHTDTMKEWYNCDNSEFINSLADKGFFIAYQSKTRTPFTPQCLAQVLTMQYLTGGFEWDQSSGWYVENATREPGLGDPADSVPTYRRLAYSKVAAFLKELGYQYIAFGNWLSSSRWDSYMEDNADLYFNYYEEGGATPWTSEFQEVLWSTTMLRPFYYHIFESQHETSWRRQTLSTMEHLKELPEMEGPQFVFAHLFCPHARYVFGPEGEYVDPLNWRNYKDKQFYRGQHIFMSTEIEKVIDVLLDKSEIPPIIILQSDHGQRPHHPGIIIGPDEWHKILNSMYLPGMDYTEISDSISPVNTFRLIFSHYFGADYTMLEDD